MKKSKSSIKKALLAFAVAATMTCCGMAAFTLTGCNDETPPRKEQSLPVSVTVIDSAGGSVTTDKTSYVVGDTVTLTITPEVGYVFGSISVGGQDRTASVKNGVLVLENVTSDITVSAVFNARETATVTASVKDNKGGTATLSSTSGYVGDNISLTLLPETGYEVISIKVNGAEKIGELGETNVLSLTLNSAATEIIVEFYQMPIEAFITCNEYGTASITDKKESYNIGDTLEVVLTPAENCKLTSVLVNGQDRTDSVSEGKLTISVTSLGNINITAIFEINPVACEFAVTATRFGTAYDIKGKEVILEHKEYDKTYKLSINDDGKISAELIPGEYLMTVNGCIPVEVTVTANGVDGAKSVYYQIYDENNMSGTADVGTQDTVTLKSAYAWITSKDSFIGDTLFTTRMKHSSASTYFAVGLFGGDKNSMISIVSEGNSDKLHFKKYGDVLFGGAGFVYSGEYSVNLNSTEQTEFTGQSGLLIKVVRKGDILCLIVGENERCIESWNISDYGQELKFGMCTFGNTPYTFTVSATQDEDTINSLVSGEVTVSQDITNGAVTLDREGGKYYLGETVTLTVTPKTSDNENIAYVLKSLTVGGENVTANVSGGKYSFKLSTKTCNVTAEFEQVSYAGLNVNINGIKFGETQIIDKVYVSSANYERTEHTLTNGKLILNRLVEGEYTIEADGYMPAQVTVSKDAESYADITLKYQMFAEKAGWSIGEDVITRTAGGGNGGDSLHFKDILGDFIFEATVKNYTDKGDASGSRFHVTFKFADGADKDKVIPFGIYGDWTQKITDGWGNAWNSTNFIGSFNTVGNVKMPDDAIADFKNNDGVKLQLVRKGTKIYMFLAGHYVNSWDCTDAGVNVAISVWGLTDVDIPVAMSLDADEINRMIASSVTASVTSGTEYGSVTLDKESGKYNLGDTVTVSVTPNSSSDENIVYVLKSLKIGTQDVTDEVSGGKYTFTVGEKSITVTAEFEQVSYANLSVNISGTKYGEAQAFDKVYLSSANYQKTEHTLTDGTLTARLVEGEYTLEVEGYLPQKINVSGNTSSYSDITLAYQIFDGNHKDGSVDISVANKVTLNSAYSWITSKDSFAGDVMFTTTLKHTGAVNYFAVAFLGDKNTFVSVTASDNGSLIRFTGYGDGALWSNCQRLEANDQSFTLTDAEKAVYAADGLTLKIVRKGNVLCIIINDGNTERLLKSYDITSHASEKMQFGMCTFGSVAYTFPVTVTQKADEISQVVSSTVTADLQGEAGGSVSLDKPDGKYNLGETVTVTITIPDDADENTVYTVKSLTVNSVDCKESVTATDSGFVYTFTATDKSYEIKAELEKTEYANLAVNVSGLKYGVSQTINSVTLKNAAAGYEQTHSLTDGLLSVNKLIPGEYTVEAEGYISAKITVAKDTSYDDISLVYQPFEVNAGTINLDTYKDGYLTIPGWAAVKSKEDITGDFIFSADVKHSNTDNFSRKILAVYFKDQNKAFTVGTNNNLTHEICYMPVTADAIWSGTTYFYGSEWKADAITDAEWKADQKCELTVKIVRKGTKLYIFVGHTPEGGEYTERLLREVETEYSGAVEIGYYNVAEENKININVNRNQEDINALVGNKNLDVTIEFNKYGTKQAGITSVKLNDTEYTLTDGKLTVSDLPMGLYTLTAEGYAPHTLNLLAENGKTVTMQYQLLTNAKNLSIDTIDEGYVNVPSWGQANLKDSFSGDFVFTTAVKHFNNGGYKRTYFLFRLVEENKFLAIGADANDAHQIALMDVGGDALWEAADVNGGKFQDWETLDMNDTEWSNDQANGVLLKLVRKQSKMYLFISSSADGVNYTDRLIKTFDSEEIEGEIQLGFINIADTTFRMPVSMDTTQAAVDAMVAKVTA